MKPFPTILIFVVVVFGVGWTSRVLTEQLSDRPRVEGERRGPRGHRGGWGRFPAGPYLGNVERFADELELSSGQRESLQQLIRETTEEIREREKGIREVVYETKTQIATLLTDAQRQQLDDLNRQRWQEYRARKLQRTLSWLEEECAIDAARLQQVAGILGDYDEQRSSFFRELEKDGSPQDRESRRNELKRLEAERDQKLAEVIGEENLERFVNAGIERRRSFDRGKRRRGPEGDRGRREGVKE